MADKLHISWDEFNERTIQLGNQIKATGKDYKGIITITRGGLVPSAILAHVLGIRMLDIVATISYNGQDQSDEVKITNQPELALKDNKGEGWLLVDDLSDTGKTFKELKKLLPNATTTTVYVKPQGKNYVSHFLLEVPQETWIVLPWEHD